MKLVLAGLIIFNMTFVQAQNFKEHQLRFERVRAAFEEKEETIKNLFTRAGIKYPPANIFIRAFKKDAVVELWASDSAQKQYKLVKSYPICAASGVLGPKRREGDLQVPEGFYHIDIFNPMSKFHLSMRVNYPNDSDRLLGYRPRLGGDIYIHGSCVTIGCIPLTDDGIKELYPIAVMAKASGQKRIPVHIFPTKLDSRGLAWLQREYSSEKALLEFWQGLAPGYDYFEKHRRLPLVTVDHKGRYNFK